MAISLFNGKLALNSIASLSGGGNETMTGVVVLKSAEITAVKAGDRVIYPKSASRNVLYDGNEYVLIKFTEIDGKL